MKRFTINCLLFLIVYFQLLPVAFDAQNVDKKPDNTRSDTQKSSDLIHFGDLIDVDVIGSAEFDWRGTLTPEGFLNGVDFVEDQIYALCRSEEAVAKDIANGFKKILRDPQVVVKIVDRGGRAVSYLYGAVKTPQRFQIKRPVRLNELLIIAGGIDEKASGEIQILRSGSLTCQDLNSPGESSPRNFGSELVKVSISDLIKGSDSANPQIMNGDVITVAEADPIYVIGGVENPRQINARSQMTVSRAIASAGGFTKNADVKSIVVFRRAKNRTERIEIDFNKIESSAAEDLVLQKYDIVEVAQNGSEKRKFAPVVKLYDNNIGRVEMPLRIIE